MSQNLRKAPIFEHLNSTDYSQLVSCMTQRRIQKGTVVFEQGQRGDVMIVVVDGRLGVRLGGTDTQQTEVAEILPGGVVGEMACLDQETRSATVVANSNALILELNRNLFQSLSSHAPSVAAGLLAGIIGQVNSRLRDTNNRLIEDEPEQLPPPGFGTPRRPTASAASYTDLDTLAREALANTSSGMQALDDASLAHLLSLATPRIFNHGEVICQEGEYGTTAYALLHGEVEVYKQSHYGVRRLGTIGAGTIVGQLSPIDALPRTATVKAVGEVAALELDWPMFHELAKLGAPVATRLYERVALATCQQLRMADNLLSEQSDQTETPTEQPQPIKQVTNGQRAPQPPQPIQATRPEPRVHRPKQTVDQPPSSKASSTQNQQPLARKPAVAPTLEAMMSPQGREADQAFSLKRTPLAVVVANICAAERSGWLEARGPKVDLRARFQDGLLIEWHDTKQSDLRLWQTAAMTAGIKLTASQDILMTAWQKNGPEEILVQEGHLKKGPAQRLLSRRLTLQASRAMDAGWAGKAVFRPSWSAEGGQPTLLPSPQVPLPVAIWNALRRKATGGAQRQLRRWLSKLQPGALKLSDGPHLTLDRLDTRALEAPYVERFLEAPATTLASLKAQGGVPDPALTALWCLHRLGIVSTGKSARGANGADGLSQLTAMLDKQQGQNHFEVLGLHWNAHPSKLAQAHERQVAKLGAAPTSSEGQEIWTKVRQRLSKALSVLSDTERRQRYRVSIVGHDLKHGVSQALEHGELHLLRGEMKEAKECFEKALDMAPSSTTAKASLNRCIQMGR